MCDLIFDEKDIIVLKVCPIKIDHLAEFIHNNKSLDQVTNHNNQSPYLCPANEVNTFVGASRKSLRVGLNTIN